jgi:hypothetical protein
LQADVVHMSHALQVFDFFHSVLAKKVRQKVVKEGKSRGQFLLWVRADEHYSRRVGLKSDWTIYFRHHEKNRNGESTTNSLANASIHALADANML